jgi:hypothetical protein
MIKLNTMSSIGVKLICGMSSWWVFKGMVQGSRFKVQSSTFKI